jgi:hypothetical protein
VKFNPFAMTSHNEWRLPRIVFHAVHVLMGVLFAFLPLPLWARLVLAGALAIYSKFVWIDWHRTSGRFFHPWVSYTLNAPDFVSDLGLTLLGASLPGAVVMAGGYYVLSTFNDP